MRNIDFSGEVNYERICELLVSLRIGKSSHQCVWIDSFGGTFDFFPRLAASFETLSFITVGIKVYSAAVFLYMHGLERLAFPESKFLFHEACIGVEGHGDVALSDFGAFLDSSFDILDAHGIKYEEAERFYRKMEESYNLNVKFIAERSTMREDKLRQLVREGTTLTAQEALEYGIVHRIISRNEISVRGNHL